MATYQPTTNPRRRSRFRVIGLQVRAVLWTLVSKPLLGLIVFPISSEGARLILPSLSKPLSSLPALGALADFEATYQIDLAHCFALGLMMAAFTMSGHLIAIRLELQIAARYSSREAKGFIVGLGLLVLMTDLALFYLGVQETQWGGAGLAPEPLLASLAYIGVVLFTSYVSQTLHERIEEALEG